MRSDSVQLINKNELRDLDIELVKKLSRPFPRRPLKPLPWMDAADENFERFLLSLRDTLITKIDTNGFPNTDIDPDDAKRLLHCPGVAGTPSGTVICDTSHLVKDVTRGFLVDSHRELFNIVMDLCCSEWRPSKIVIAKHSSSGFPDVTFDAEIKKERALNVLTDIRGALATGSVDWQGLSDRNIMAPVYIQNYRLSPDAYRKKRLVASVTGAEKGVLDTQIDYVTRRNPRSGLITGGTFGKVTSLEAMRPRHVMGLNHRANVILAIVRAGLTKCMYGAYPFTFEHRGMSDIQRKIDDVTSRGLTVINSVDVNQFDRSVQIWMLNAIVDGICDRLSIIDEWRIYAKACLVAPILQPDTGDGLGPRIVRASNPGLLSGIDLVSLAGKLLNIFNLLVGFFTISGRSITSATVGRILKGEDSSIALLNMGDDNLILTNRNIDVNRMFKACPYFSVAREEHSRFIGYEIRDNKVYPDLAKMGLNFFIRERGYDSRIKKHWDIGFLARLTNYQQHPDYITYRDAINTSHKLVYGQLFTVAFHNSLPQFGTKVTSTLSEIDLIYLDNPDAIHYKIDINDVNPQLVSEGHIPEDVVAKAFGQLTS